MGRWEITMWELKDALMEVKMDKHKRYKIDPEMIKYLEMSRNKCLWDIFRMT